ncbi:MAG: cytochrome C oxidase subunit IV family protein [Gammaproteobacteria bacterium]|jgi:caa(3)-type oxidase subunit IV
MASEGQQHPLGIYFAIWALLFALSAVSYASDFLPHGYFRWSVILVAMFLKAGFIVAIFMHMKWERLALIMTVLGPPAVLLVLIGLMAVEGDYVNSTRGEFFSAEIQPEGHLAVEGGEEH